MEDKKVNLYTGDTDGDDPRLGTCDAIWEILNRAPTRSRKAFQTITAPQNEQVNHPSHYNFGSIEVIDYIRSTLGEEGCRDFCVGNVLKYVSRAKHKGKPVEDLEKASWYLDYAIEIERRTHSQDDKQEKITENT